MITINSRRDFHKLLRHLNLNGVGAEIGVWRGDFSECLLSTSDLKQVVSIDAWDATFCKAKWTQQDLDDAYAGCQAKFAKFGERSRIIKATSVDAAAMFPNRHFDFVYVDAGHEYKSVKQDLDAWWPKLKLGGLFAGHDYYGRTDLEDWGIIKAVNEHVGLHNVDLYVCDENGQKWKSWYCLKVAKG